MSKIRKSAFSVANAPRFLTFGPVARIGLAHLCLQSGRFNSCGNWLVWTVSRQRGAFWLRCDRVSIPQTIRVMAACSCVSPCWEGSRCRAPSCRLARLFLQKRSLYSPSSEQAGQRPTCDPLAYCTTFTTELEVESGTLNTFKAKSWWKLWVIVPILLVPQAASNQSNPLNILKYLQQQIIC